MRSVIEDLWTALATIAAAAFDGARIDSAHPGYVIRDQVLVPFYLLEDVPGTSELAELVALGLSLRLTADGVICLSGSTALLGTLKFVGDVDYCEYAVPGTYTTVDVVTSASAHAVRTALPLCERIKVMNSKWSKNCGAWDETASAELTRYIDEEGAFQLKLDFLTDTQSVGAVEATNMALLLIEDREDEILRASFAAQEVPIPGSVLPRPLSDPLQLGRYINFLIKQLQDYAEMNPVKALKRALSLARVLLLAKWNDALVECLQDPRAALATAFDARKRLLDMLGVAAETDDDRTQIRRSLQQSLEKTVTELEQTLAATMSPTQATAEVWAAQVLLVLSSFVQDARQAIGAV